MCDFEDTKLLMKKVELNCPNCQADLTIGGAIYNLRSGLQKNILIYRYEHNYFDWDEFEFVPDQIIEEYKCAKCEADVSTVIKRYI